MTETTAASPAESLFDRHRDRLEAAVAACASREYYSAFDESPSPRVYGESAAAEGKAAFEAWLGGAFPLDTPGAEGTVATERSPYGFDLEVAYPRAVDIDALMSAARAGMRAWRDAGPDGRTGVCLEILSQLHTRIFELAGAVQHTSGQAFVMAFQAGGAHALDRAVEAIAYAWTEMSRTPATALWEKPGRGEPLRMEKTFTVVPRGVALVIGCNTFPTWNSWPGLFASLVTGNAVVVKPHPAAVLPLAITVQVCREVLVAAGFDPDLVTLAAEDPDDHLAATLAVRPEVRLVDFTGGNAFGDWLEANARQAVVFTEKAGVNTVVLDSTSDFAAMCQNLAFSFSLYSGQMCTAPQNVYVPAAGIATEDGVRTPAEVGAGIGAALDRLLGDDARAVELLGGIVNDDVLERLDAAHRRGEVLVASRTVTHPSYAEATVRTPALVRLTAADAGVYEAECFGPVAYLIETAGTDESVALFRDTVQRHGAMTAAVYSTSEGVVGQVREAALDAGVALSENLLGGVFVNQSAAYSDFHGTGANPAANSSYTDGAYVAPRFRVVQSRRHV
ncbi:phenylacetic acid degradation protein PaaN [Nocardioides sp. T2.26MG-1]|uniref:phenylacetic acid degradation protein PaaN n=1 Tax=Nocardioides sp. T2.26MG-1 TaxID=3041166 RepID=UPI0024773EDB|nr:phenylacetic acid degradation protein PaaN [Nocardioides sp. T2.26MG-1]CAI9411720.1 N-succinylglutamate 5-semialdehyde dehydrogenase [Nocardioides sp. T2.26MG-1]